MSPFPRATPADESARIERGVARSGFEPSLHGDPRHYFTLYFLIPICLLFASAFVALVGGTMWLTALQNRAEAVAEQERVKARFLSRVEAIQATNGVFAVWDEAARRLVATFDADWADRNEGAYVFDQKGIESSFVIDQSGR